MLALSGYSDADLHQRLAHAADHHPRLGLASPVIPNDPGRLQRADVFVEPARDLLSKPPLVREMEGRRLLAVSREALWRLGTLSVAWLRTRDRVFLRRAEEELLAVCAFSDWNPSHYLDTAEMALGVALAYDWLHADLSPDVRETVAEALWRLGLETALDESAFWVTARNNWGQVCHTGMLAAAIALAERHPDAAFRVVRRAFHNLPFSLEAYEPDGVYPEGPMYWDYGTGFNVAFLILTESALGTSYGLSEWPGFARSAEFVQHAVGPGGEPFAFADCRRGRWTSLFLPWFSTRFGIPLAPDAPEAVAFQSHPERYARNRLAPLMLMAGPQDLRLATDASARPLDWTGGGKSAVAMFRGGWRPDAWYLAVKGGSPSANHGHMDAGGFVLDAHGQRWAEDAGMEEYHLLESRGYNLWQSSQDGLRWGVFRYGVESHNIPVINGARQKVEGLAPVAVRDLGGTSPEATLDLSSLYGLPVHRRFRFAGRNSVRIDDRFARLPKGARVRWQFLTQASVTANGTDLLLRRGPAVLCVSNGGVAAWKVEEAASLLHEWDSPLPGFRRVSFECQVPDGGELEIGVCFADPA